MTIEFAESSSGRKYVADDIADLSAEDQIAITDGLRDLEGTSFQNLIASGAVRPLHLDRCKLYELIVISLNAGYRIFFIHREQIYWILHMIKKKTNKTPQRELELAIQREKLIPI